MQLIEQDITQIVNIILELQGSTRAKRPLFKWLFH